MKKIIILIVILTLSLAACAQQVAFTNIEIRKATPVLHLNGTNAALNFYNSDIVLQQSSNQLTLSGGNLSIGANDLLGTGSIGATGSRLTKGWLINLEITNLPTVNGGSFKTALSLTASDVGLGNVTNESKATMFTAPTFTTSASLPTSTTIGSVSSTEIGYVDGLNGTAASRQDVADSLAQALSGAVEVIALADSTMSVGKAEGSYVTGMDWDNGNIPSQLKALQAFGANMKALSVFGFNPTVGHSLSDATCVGIAIYINEPTTVTGAGWIQLSAGDYTAADYNGFALYSVSGTTYTLVASTTSDGDMWKSGAFSINQRAFVGNPISLSVGAYYLVSFYNQSAQVTSPGVFHSPNIYNSIIVGITGTNKTCWLRYTTTTVPSSITAATTYALVEPPVYWLY